MASRGQSRYRKPKQKTSSVPQSTPATTARIQSTTGRVSTGSAMDRLRYHKRPSIKEQVEVEEDGLTAQTVGAGVIGTIGKTAVKAGEVATKVTAKVTAKKIKKVGRRGIAPGVSAATGPMEKKEPVEKVSTDIFGATVPGHDDESYKEGPSHIFDWKGYYNILRGVVVPTEQLIQMSKDIMEGVPEEKRTMRESGLDLALMPILAPLIGQGKEGYDIGTEEYQPWEYGFADPRNIFTGTMAHNLAVAGYAIQQPAYYEAVGKEYEVSSEKFEKHKPYYIATAVGELPYFMLGVGEAGFAAKVGLKAAAGGVRVATGAKKAIPSQMKWFRDPLPGTGTLKGSELSEAVRMTQISRPWLAGKGQMLAYDIETAPTRVARALTKLRRPTPMGIRITPRVTEDEFGDIHTQWDVTPAQKTSWAAVGKEPKAIKRFVYRLQRKKQEDTVALTNLFSQAFKVMEPGERGSMFLSEIGDIIHIPGTTGKWSGRYVGGDVSGKGAGFGDAPRWGQVYGKGPYRNYYENLLDPTIEYSMTGQPYTRYLEPTAGLTSDTSKILDDPDIARIISDSLSSKSDVTIDNALTFGRTTRGQAIPAEGGRTSGIAWATGMEPRKNIPSLTERYRPADIIREIQLKQERKRTVYDKTKGGVEKKGKKLVPILTQEDIPPWKPGGMPREYSAGVVSGAHGVPTSVTSPQKISWAYEKLDPELQTFMKEKARTQPDPITDFQDVMEQRGYQMYGLRDPIPGTPEAKRFDSLISKRHDLQMEIDVLTQSKSFEGMKGVSWYELSTDGRFANQKQWFESSIPTKYKAKKQDDPPDVVKLKEEYVDVQSKMKESNALESEKKLRSIGNKISEKMYGSKGIDSGDIREAKTLYARGRNIDSDAEFERTIIQSLPFQTQKRITALKAQREAAASEMETILETSPKVLGPKYQKLKVLLETKPGLKESLYDFRPPKGIRVYQEPGGSPRFGGKMYRIEVEDVPDPTTGLMTTFFAHKATKSAAKSADLPDPKYYTIPKHMRGKSKEDTWVIEAQKAKDDPDLVSKMIGHGPKSRDRTKILEVDLGDTSLIRDEKFRRAWGIEESIITVGKETKSKIKRLPTYFFWKSASLFRRKRSDWQEFKKAEEFIEDKKAYYVSNKGKDPITGKEWEMNRKDVEKFLESGTTGDEAKDQVLTMRKRLFGGESEYGLQQSVLKDQVKVEEISKAIDAIIDERNVKLRDVQLREVLAKGSPSPGAKGVKGVYSAILADEKTSYYKGHMIGNVSFAAARKPYTKNEISERMFSDKFENLTDEHQEVVMKELYPYGAYPKNTLAKERFGLAYEYLSQASKDIIDEDVSHIDLVKLKPGHNVLNVNEINDKTILRYDVPGMDHGWYGSKPKPSTPDSVAEQWRKLQTKQKEAKEMIKVSDSEKAGVKGLIEREKSYRKVLDVAEPETEVFGKTDTPKQRPLASLTPEWQKAQIDNEIKAVEYRSMETLRFQHTYNMVEEILRKRKMKDVGFSSDPRPPRSDYSFPQVADESPQGFYEGTPVIKEGEGELFIEDFRAWKNVYNEVLEKPTFKERISELAKNNPGFDEVRVGEAIGDVESDLANTQSKIRDIETKLDNNSIRHERMEMFQTHLQILRDTEEIQKLKLERFKNNKGAFEQIRAKNLIEENQNMEGELPMDIQRRLDSIRVRISGVKKEGSRAKFEQFKLQKQLIKRVAAKGEKDKVNLFYHPDAQKNFVVGKTAKWLAADEPYQHEIRQRRAHLERKIGNLERDKFENNVNISAWKQEELIGYAKLNLERKLYNLNKKYLDPEQIGDSKYLFAEIRDTKNEIIGLETIVGEPGYQKKLIELATSGEETSTKGSIVPSEYGKNVTIESRTLDVKGAEDRLKFISGGQEGMDQIGVADASSYGFRTGGTMPKGYKTTKGKTGGVIFAKKYGLVEGPTKSYAARTEKNVIDADLTIIFGDAKLIAKDGGKVKIDKRTGAEIGPGEPIIEGSGPGSKLTLKTAIEQNKPYLLNPTAQEIEQTVKSTNARVINIAGSRTVGDKYTTSGRRELQIFFKANKPESNWSPTLANEYRVVDPDKFVKLHPDWAEVLVPEELRPIKSDEIWMAHQGAHPNAVKGTTEVSFKNIKEIDKRMKTVENELDSIKYHRVTREPAFYDEARTQPNPSYKSDEEWAKWKTDRTAALKSELESLKDLYTAAKSRHKGVHVKYEDLTDETISKYPGNLEGTIYNIKEADSKIFTLEEVVNKDIEKKIRGIEVEKAAINDIVEVEPRYQSMTEEIGNWDPYESHYTKWTKWYKIMADKKEARELKKPQLMKLWKKKKLTQERIDATVKQQDIIRKLDPKWRNFSLIPRGTVYRFTGQTLADEVPKRETTIVEIRGQDGKQYIEKDYKFYEVPDGYWKGIAGEVDEYGNPIATQQERLASKQGLIPISKEKEAEIFKKPLDGLKKFVVEKREQAIDKLHPLDEKFGVEPTPAQKAAIIDKGMPPGYAVASTTVSRLAAKAGVRGGTDSRLAAPFTMTGWATVLGKVSERFVADTSRHLEKKTIAGRLVFEKEIDEYVPKYASGTPGKGRKTKYELQYAISRLLSEKTSDTHIPAGVIKEKLYQMPTVLPDRPSEDLMKIEAMYEKVYGRGKGDIGDVPPDFRMDVTEEPYLKDLYPSPRNMDRYYAGTRDEVSAKKFNTKYDDLSPDEKALVDETASPLPENYSSIPYRVLSLRGGGGKEKMRRAVAFKWLKNVKEYKVKSKTEGFTDNEPFVKKEANDKFKELVNNEEVFIDKLEDISDPKYSGRLSGWDRFQQSLFHQDLAAKRNMVDVHEVLPDDVWLGKGHWWHHFDLRSAPGSRLFVEKEVYQNPAELLQHQALIAQARDVGLKLTKDEKRILKFKAKMSEYQDAETRIVKRMVHDTGQEAPPRDWSDMDWDLLAERDPTWKPQVQQMKNMGTQMDKIESTVAKIRHEKTQKRQLEQLKSRTSDQNKELKSINTKIKNLELEKTNREANLKGYFQRSSSDPKDRVLQSVLHDVQPKPIYENGKLVGYEETPFTHFKKPGEEGYKSKLNEAAIWFASKERRGPPQTISGYKKQPPMWKTEATAEGRRFKRSAAQPGKAVFTSKKGAEYEGKVTYPHKVTATYDPTYVSVADTQDAFYKSFGTGTTWKADEIQGVKAHAERGGIYGQSISRVTVADVKRLQSVIAGKKLSKQGLENLDASITKLRSDLDEMNMRDTTSYNATEMDKFTAERKFLIESLRNEINKRGMQSDRIKDFNVIDIDDIERGTYTTESGRSQQAALIADKLQAEAQAGFISPPPPKYLGSTREKFSLPGSISPSMPGLSSAVLLSTPGMLPEASATQGPASATLDENLDQLSKNMDQEKIRGVIADKPTLREIPKITPRGRIDISSTLKMATGEQAKTTTGEPGPAAALLTQTKQKVISKGKEEYLLKSDIPQKTTPVSITETPLLRTIPPARIRLPPPVMFAWLDPEQRRKRAAKVKKKKKKKIAWAAPSWWAGKGYYFPSGAAYTSFKRKEPKVVRRQERKLGEPKWSESKTRSVFAERPITKRKPRGFISPPSQKKPRRRKKRSDIFGSTSGKSSGY